MSDLSKSSEFPASPVGPELPTYDDIKKLNEQALGIYNLAADPRNPQLTGWRTAYDETGAHFISTASKHQTASPLEIHCRQAASALDQRIADTGEADVDVTMILRHEIEMGYRQQRLDYQLRMGEFPHSQPKVILKVSEHDKGLGGGTPSKETPPEALTLSGGLCADLSAALGMIEKSPPQQMPRPSHQRGFKRIFGMLLPPSSPTTS